MDTVQGVGDDEINQMIASLKGENSNLDAMQSHGAVAQNSPVNLPNNNNSPEKAENISTQNESGAKIISPNPAQNINQVAPPDPAAANLPIANNSENFAKNVPNQNALKLDEIKTNAIHELRPLVDKLNLPPEDKFDTLLLLIRSTDDSSLIPMAHKTALSISDDARRAQALLEIIKEIDFFSQNSAK